MDGHDGLQVKVNLTLQNSINGSLSLYMAVSIYEFTGIKPINWNYFTGIYPTIYMRSGCLKKVLLWKINASIWFRWMKKTNSLTEDKRQGA